MIAKTRENVLRRNAGIAHPLLIDVICGIEDIDGRPPVCQAFYRNGTAMQLTGPPVLSFALNGFINLRQRSLGDELPERNILEAPESAVLAHRHSTQLPTTKLSQE